jgi:transcriptional regulator with XRE-family HTH domain
MARALRIANPNYRYKLKAAIHAAGFRSQSEFAEVNGLDQNELSRILHGLMPTRPGLRKLADALSMTIFELKQIL